VASLALFRAQAGVQLNGTLLDEAYLLALVEQVATLTSQVAALQASVALLTGKVGSPPPPPLSRSSSFISAGGLHTCVVSAAAGGMQCWGSNFYGQLGDGTMTDRLVPASVVSLSSGVAAITAGKYHTCALLAPSGGVQCWGLNGYRNIGDGTTTDRYVPTTVWGMSSGVAAITAGAYHTCALLLTSGGVRCWGYSQVNGDGTAGQFGALAFPGLDVVGLSSGVAAITAGDDHTCALLSSTGVQCWGTSTYGQLGDGATVGGQAPVSVLGLSSGASAIAAGGSHSCALIASTGGVQCWGLNNFGQLGDGTTTTQLVPTSVAGLGSGVAAIDAGYAHTCAVLFTGGVQCWGANDKGQLGDGTTTQRLVPTAVVGLSSGIVAITAGAGHTCALLASGGVQCWGLNPDGRLGDGTTTQRLVPVNVSGTGGG
jgi:alpha-tubulin suppressor-like RCC1 family protein